MPDQEPHFPKLICSVCGNQLSRFPIYAYDEQDGFHFICGRCPLRTDVTLQRQIAFETYVQDVTFPCKYKEGGCKLKLCPEDLDEHERYCTYRLSSCPSLPVTSCDWLGKYAELHEHYKQRHGKLTFSDAQKRDVDLGNGFKNNYVLRHDNVLFLVHLEYEFVDNVLSYDVSCVSSMMTSTTYSFKLTLSNALESYRSPKLSVKTEDFSCSDLRPVNLKKRDAKGTCFVEIMGGEKKFSEQTTGEAPQSASHPQEEMFKCIECPVCMEYMRPPINQCDTGHSICQNCRSRIAECPTCRKPFRDTRNFSLEDFARFVVYPCKYREYDCPIALPLKESEAHEKKCKFKPLRCPFSFDSRSCSWKNSLSKFVGHVKDCHKGCYIKGEHFCSGLKRKIYTHGVTRYDDNIFYVTHRYDGMYYLCSVALIGPSRNSDKYMFEFEISADNSGDAIVARRTCRLAKDFLPFSSHYVKLHKDTFEKGVTSQIWSYFRIMKKTQDVVTSSIA